MGFLEVLVGRRLSTNSRKATRPLVPAIEDYALFLRHGELFRCLVASGVIPLPQKPAHLHGNLCNCTNRSRESCYTDGKSIEFRAQVELMSLSPAYNGGVGACSNPTGCLCNSKGGPISCAQLYLWWIENHGIMHVKIGNNFRLSDFDGSPQQHAILNRHLMDYFRQRATATETTPYNIPVSQLHLLQGLGMEQPNADAPETPHALHKSIECFQLTRMRNYLAPNSYGAISVKSSKLNLLPTPGSVQNPVFEAKDVSRYPGTAIPHATFADWSTNFLHDVSSVVTPHELVEKLVQENPEGQLFVTGINPFEVVDKATSFEPASHTIEYDFDDFNFIFTGGESESYFTSSTVTKCWLRTNSVCASNGRVYHVVLLDYKLGHCLWHIFCGDAEAQHTRTFPTNSMVRLPAAITGTLSDEYMPVKVITGVLDFVQRTPDLSTRNLAAKVTQLSNAINPKTTSRQRWIAVHVAKNAIPNQGFWHNATRWFWNTLYLLSFQWQMFKSCPDIYDFLDERKRCRTIHPTQGGGWSPSTKWKFVDTSIPNHPTWLQRFSAFSTAVFSFVLPKLLIGEALTQVFFHVPFIEWLKTILRWLELDPLKVVLTFSIVVVTSILPGHVVKLFTRIAGHHWRQLWWPGWTRYAIRWLITELTGGPGHKVLPILPGRGWAYQAYIWAIAAYSFLPGLVPWWLFPWCTGFSVPIFVTWMLFILLENLRPFLGAPRPAFPTMLSYSLTNHQLLDNVIDLGMYLFNVFTFATLTLRWFLAGHHPNLGNCGRTPQLPAIPSTPQEPIKVRLSEQPLPPVMLRPAQMPRNNIGIALAVDPVGLNYRDWVLAVSQAYNNDPRRYPQLTPGNHCFWDCVSQLGGTPHMWYSWNMAYFGKAPDPNDPVVGNVTLAEIQLFCASSGFGLNLSGIVTGAMQPSGQGWPTLHLKLSNSVVNGRLHIETTNPADPVQTTGELAQMFSTVRAQAPATFRAFQAAFTASAPTSVPHPSPTILAWMGNHQIPTTRAEVAAALAGSFSCAPLVNNNRGHAFPFGNVPPVVLPLFTFGANMHNQRIALTDPAKFWRDKQHRCSNKALSRLCKVDMTRRPTISQVKIGASRSQQSHNRRHFNDTPSLPMWKTLADSLKSEVSKYDNIELPAVPLQEEVLFYTPDIGRAARLIADLKAHPSVLESRADKQVLQSLDSIIDLVRQGPAPKPVKVRAYLGVFGSGKTVATANYIRSLPREQQLQVRVVSHTESLRAQAKEKLDFPGLRGVNFPTLPSLITEPSTGPIVLDDAGKFWGGVLDLVLLTNPMVPEVVLNGDPAQGCEVFPVRGTQSEHDPTAIEVIAQSATKYATITHRGFQLLADTLGIHTTSKIRGHITHTTAPKVGIPVCTASPRYVQVLASAGRQAYTYSGVQGEDFSEDVEVDMTGLEGAILDRTAYVAMTRSKTGVYIHMEAANPSSAIKSPPTGSGLMNAIVYSMRECGTGRLVNPSLLIKSSFYRHLHWSMPLCPWFAPIGATIPSSAFQSVAPKCTNFYAVEDAVHDFKPNEHVIPAEGDRDWWLPETQHVAKEYRELPVRGEMTDQFKETAFVNPHVHKRSDTPTYFLSVQNRLKTASRFANARRMRKCKRKDMCDKFDELVPNPPKFTAEKYEYYVDKAIDEYCSKRTNEQVMAKLNAHDPDRTGSDIKISLKNQVIKKDEKRHKVAAIPGQLIHEYDIAQTINDAAIALFLEEELVPCFPKGVLFYRRLAPQEFIDKYQDLWHPNRGAYSSDVTRWDVGCDAGVLNFDAHVLVRCGVNADFVEAYVERRLSSRSQHGPMKTMQNSGDRFTWIINSVRRLIVTTIVLAIALARLVSGDVTVAINGDDAAMDEFATARPFPDSPWVFKDQNAMRVEFSGFELGGPTPEYSAEGISYRAAILESRDPSAKDKWINYLDLLRFCNPTTTAAMSVASRAIKYLSPSELRTFLPAPFQFLLR